MDKACMLQWVDEVLKTHVAFAAVEIIPVLLLDSYRCHMMEAINDIGVNVEHIPEGCIQLCWPVDMGLNKSFKGMMHTVWEEWMKEIP